MKYFTVIILIIFIGCNGDKHKKDLSVCEADSTNCIVNHNDTIDKGQISNVIYSEKLSSILSEFTNEVDSIPNPFGESTCYYLSFFKRNNDTLVEIAANIDFPIFLEGVPNDYESKGIFYVDEKLIAIFDKKEGLGVQFYNNEMLDYMPEFVEDSAYTKFAEQYEAWTFVPPRLLYKIENDSLILLEQYLPYFK